MRKLLVLAILAFVIYSCESVKQPENIRIAFYNVENLFDTINDPNINDEEYLPDGRAEWTSKKYDHNQRPEPHNADRRRDARRR